MELLCRTEQIAERDARSFDTPRGEVIVTQRDGEFFAYLNRCPHLGISLEFREQEFMDADHEYLICANHGALFEVHNGHCVLGPCKGDALTAVAITVHSDGGIYLASSDHA